MTDCLSLGSDIVRITTKTWRRFYHVLRSELTKLCIVLWRISVQHIHLWSAGIILMLIYMVLNVILSHDMGDWISIYRTLKKTNFKTKYRYKYFKQTWKFQQEDNDPWVKWSSPWRRDGIAWCAAGKYGQYIDTGIAVPYIKHLFMTFVTTTMRIYVKIVFTNWQLTSGVVPVLQ